MCVKDGGRISDSDSDLYFCICNYIGLKLESVSI